MSAKHSPLPWSYIPSDSSVGRRDWIEDGDGNICLENIGHLDGPFIVRASNSHEALVTALEAFVDACEKAPPLELMARIDAACVKARAALAKARN